jgi:hypothetical protein
MGGNWGQAATAWKDAVAQQATEDTYVTRAKAKQEIQGHGKSWEMFVGVHGDQPVYRGTDILRWLGY